MTKKPIHSWGPKVGRYKPSFATNIRQTFRMARQAMKQAKDQQ